MQGPTFICPPERRWTCQLAADWTIHLPRYFANIATDKVKYEVVDSYGKLMELVG